MYYSKKKDKSPNETIEHIRKILHDVGIFATESWLKPINTAYATIFSLRLNIFGIERYGTNGKGTTPEYALASAYAELMERLQSGYLIQNGDFNDFIVVPDRISLTQESFLNLKNKFLNTSFLKLLKNSFINPEIQQINSNQEILDFWINKIEGNSNGNVTAIPYFSLKEKKSMSLPQSIISCVQGTNGLCAGNTPEEALVQGLSEVLERVACFDIIKNNLTPPTIPQCEYEKYEEITRIINYYNNIGFNVVLKDCSLGKNYPVVSVAIIDKKTQKCAINYGSHPSLPVAIERCLTEASQGKNYEIKETKEKYINSFYFNNFDWRNISINIDNQIKAGAGKVTPKYFTGQHSWEYDKSTWNNDSTTNKDLLKQLVDICLKNCDDIYIRDFSYLGFPTYQICIPEMTPIPRNYKISNYLNRKHSLSYILKEYETKEGLEEIYNAAIAAKLSIKNGKNILINKVPDDFIVIDCCIKLEKDNESIKYLNEIINDYDDYGLDFDINEMCCLKTIIELRQNNYSETDILNILCTFYKESVIKKVFELWLAKDTLEQLINIESQKTGKTKQSMDIKNANIALARANEVNNRLKEVYKSNAPNQDDLIHIFNW